MAQPPRLRTWPGLLAALLASREAVPFRWGPNDCAAFAADGYLALTGVDGLAELRGPRRTEREAQRQARRIGGVVAAIERAGLPRIAPALAQRGDLVLLAQQRREVLALCLGEKAAAPGATGLVRVSMNQAVAAWRIGG